jgi:hypothetical protein
MSLGTIFTDQSENSQRISLLSVPNLPATIKNGNLKGLSKVDFNNLISRFNGFPKNYMIEVYGNCKVISFFTQDIISESSFKKNERIEWIEEPQILYNISCLDQPIKEIHNISSSEYEEDIENESRQKVCHIPPFQILFDIDDEN